MNLGIEVLQSKINDYKIQKKIFEESNYTPEYKQRFIKDFSAKIEELEKAKYILKLAGDCVGSVTLDPKLVMEKPKRTWLGATPENTIFKNEKKLNVKLILDGKEIEVPPVKFDPEAEQTEPTIEIIEPKCTNCNDLGVTKGALGILKCENCNK